MSRFVVDNILSLALIAFELVSYALCATIMCTISVTTSTFELSRNPWIISPIPFCPGVPVIGLPDAVVSL
jgi:hypothetical protein